MDRIQRYKLHDVGNELGTVNGPYTHSGNGHVYVVIKIYDKSLNIIKNKTIKYQKYLEEFKNGLHQYRDPFPYKNNINKGDSLKRNCVLCNKPFVGINFKNIYCSTKCSDEHKLIKRKQQRIKRADRLDQQIVIPIKGLESKEVEYYYLVDLRKNKRKPILIPKDKTKLVHYNDSNGILKHRFLYIRKHGQRIKPVKGYKKFFWITDTGILISRRTRKILSLTLSKTGYWTHATKIGGRNGKTLCFKIHRLICDAFLPNPENKPFVNHKDGVKTNNHYTNLEWCTASENNKHAFKMGLTKPLSGINNKQATLTKSDITRIFELHDTKLSQYKIANITGFTRYIVNNLLSGKTYINEVSDIIKKIRI